MDKAGIFKWNLEIYNLRYNSLIVGLLSEHFVILLKVFCLDMINRVNIIQ